MRSLWISCVILGLGMQLACVKPPAGGGDNDENVVFAVVNGKEIKGKEVLDKIKGDLAELQRNAYDLKRRATEEMVQKAILDEEAKKQGVSIEQLFGKFEALKDQDVSKDDIKHFLAQRNIDEKKLTKQEKESVPQIIKMQRVYEARQKFVNELRSKANVQFKLAKPQEKPVEVAVGSGPARGNANAKVKIVEFSDFQCPFCSRGRQRMDEVLEKYKDKVAFYFRHLPLESIHPNAFKASEASLCALDQNKFWEYHDKLFDNQSKLDEGSLIEYAKALKLDEKTFSECLKSGKKAAEVRKDMEDATKLGVNSTPTFFVNGHIVRGAQPLEAFSEIIDEAAKN